MIKNIEILDSELLEKPEETMILDEYDFHTAKAGNPISCLKKWISNNFKTSKSL